MEMTPVASTLIASVGYDEGKQELHVNFRSGDHYIYEEVPPYVFEGLKNTKSPGAYLAQNIKFIYTFRKEPRENPLP